MKSREGDMKSSSRTSNHQDLRFHISKRLEVQAQADAKELDGGRPTSCVRHAFQIHDIHPAWIHQTVKRGTYTICEEVSKDTESVAPWTTLHSR